METPKIIKYTSKLTILVQILSLLSLVARLEIELSVLDMILSTLVLVILISAEISDSCYFQIELDLCMVLLTFTKARIFSKY